MTVPAWAAAAATGVQVGAAMAMSAAAVAETGASLLALMRYGFAFVVILPGLRQTGWRPPPGRDLLTIGLIGAGQFGVLVVLLNVALVTASAHQVALVFSAMPLLALAMSARAERRTVGACQRLAIAGAVLSAGLAVAPQALATGPSATLPGLLAALLATALGAGCAAWHRPYLSRYGVARVSAISMAAALPLLAVASLIEGAPVAPAAWSVTTLVLVAGLGLSSGVGYLLWLHALKDLPAGVAAAFLGLGPMTALAVQWATSAAPIMATDLAATLMLAASLAHLARDPTRRKTDSKEMPHA